MGWVILGVVIVLILAWLVFTYNGLVTARNRTQEAWSEIDVELKRRHDLIPNLVNTVQGYMGHERGTLEAVTNARANAVAAGATGDPAKIGQAENVLSQSLRSLFAVSENYPELKAIGLKASPGPLYGMAGDCWAALGVAITAAETSA